MCNICDLRKRRIWNIHIYVCETYVMPMWSVCAAYMQRMWKHMRTLCETYAKHTWNINVFCVWVALCLCLCFRIRVFFKVGGKITPYFVHITQNKALLFIVRKENRKRHINKSQTITHKDFVTFMFAIFMSCVYVRRNKSLFCTNKVIFWPLRKRNRNKT